MKIETEYSPGDIAWVMNDNRIAKVRIEKPILQNFVKTGKLTK
jgi:hypothetical protein